MIIINFKEKFFYINKNKAHELLTLCKNKKTDKGGTNSKAWIFENFAVLKSINIQQKDLNLFPNREVSFNIIKQTFSIKKYGRKCCTNFRILL